jgi:hypothetical protein
MLEIRSFSAPMDLFGRPTETVSQTQWRCSLIPDPGSECRTHVAPLRTLHMKESTVTECRVVVVVYPFPPAKR